MKELKFVAFHGKSFISKCIRYFTRSRLYSHIAVLLSDNGDLIEAWEQSGMKACVDWSNINKHTDGTKYEVWGLEVDDFVYESCMQFYSNNARRRTGYDYKGVIGFIFKKAVKENPNKFFCSEFCIYPLCISKKWTTIKPHLVSPRDFVNIIEASGGRLIDNGFVSING